MAQLLLSLNTIFFIKAAYIETMQPPRAMSRKDPPGLFGAYSKATDILCRTSQLGYELSENVKPSISEGKYVSTKADTSLINNVDEICRDISSREMAVNLFNSYYGNIHRDTLDGLSLDISLVVYFRNRFFTRSSSLLQEAWNLRRIVSVFAGRQERPVDVSDFQSSKFAPISQTGHTATMITFSVETTAKRALTVSFIHNSPGLLKTNIIRVVKRARVWLTSVVASITSPFLSMAENEWYSSRDCMMNPFLRYYSSFWKAGQDLGSWKG
ncbi:hypothetical protein EJ08DRAFT_699554 [Tothia fuscella]|uniref:Uncharacterized protein n=1 Tax=Tothia fuscella TaxID=1048955 RepID=A0A9P4NML6_9PEZI|nr:hypothetical protein EJ08DRAFT_699554 [Tothia fuscella]